MDLSTATTTSLLVSISSASLPTTTTGWSSSTRASRRVSFECRRLGPLARGTALCHRAAVDREAQYGQAHQVPPQRNRTASAHEHVVKGADSAENGAAAEASE